MFSKSLIFLLFAILSAVCFSALVKRNAPIQIKDKFKDFRENCFPRESGNGCKCITGDQSKKETVFDSDDKCKIPVELKIAENKKKLNEEFEQKYGSLKENCFPRPGKGCRCAEKDAQGNEIEKKYEDDANCKISLNRNKRDSSVLVRNKNNEDLTILTNRKKQNQNVRDPVREQAEKNHAEVIKELKAKFRALKKDCYPMPKGCRCVTGKDKNGREIVDRRYNEEECRCKDDDKLSDCQRN